MKHFAILILITLAAAPLGAQPMLELRKLRPHSPDYYYYHLYFAAYCDGQTIFDLDERQLILKEEGELVDTSRYNIDRRPDMERSSCFDAVLAFDNSSKVYGETLEQMKEGGRRFIEVLERDCQRAAVLTFSSQMVNILCWVTNDKDQLMQALEGWTPAGTRTIWDAVNVARTELYTHGYTRIQPVILVTTGGDQGSARRYEDVLGSLLNTDVRVFVVYVGYEPGSDELQQMATETGGMFIKLHTPAELPETLAWLAQYTRREFDEYRIVRSTRSVDNKQSFRVSMRLEACTDSVWVDRLFRFSMAATSAGDVPAPRQVELGQAYPNPLTVGGGRGTIEFTLSAALASTHVSLMLYDMLGREVRTLYEGTADIGSNSIRFDPSVLSPGVYMYTLRSGGTAVSRKMVVLP